MAGHHVSIHDALQCWHAVAAHAIVPHFSGSYSLTSLLAACMIPGQIHCICDKLLNIHTV